MATDETFKPSAAARAEQRGVVLAALREGPLSTIEARERLGAMSPAARVMELRRMGYAIETRRSRQLDAAGRVHTVAAYVLVGEVAA